MTKNYEDKTTQKAVPPTAVVNHTAFARCNQFENLHLLTHKKRRAAPCLRSMDWGAQHKQQGNVNALHLWARQLPCFSLRPHMQRDLKRRALLAQDWTPRRRSSCASTCARAGMCACMLMCKRIPDTRHAQEKQVLFNNAADQDTCAVDMSRRQKRRRHCHSSYLVVLRDKDIRITALSAMVAVWSRAI